MFYYPIIGLEIHVQLNTKTKLFCRCLNEYTPDEPNKNICPFCTGQPGALPVLNKEAVKKALIFGTAIKANIPDETRWDRKNYFYPDLPAGYQISQYDNPIVEGGVIEFFIEDPNGKDYTESKVELTRAHLEADAGKSLHVSKKTLLDYNRSGAPLIEIVTEPVIRSSAQAMSFVSELQLLVRTLGISNADMEKGQMRFDCNISLQTKQEKDSQKLPDYKVEIKNINSIRSLGRAIEYETQRQTKLLEEGISPSQETRGWRDDVNKSESQRSKEQAHDYRYFPEPDLQILTIRDKDKPKLSDLPELPMARRKKYLDLDIGLQNANTFVQQKETGDLFNACLGLMQEKDKKTTRTIANIITTNLIGANTKDNQSIKEILFPEQILEVANLYTSGKLSNTGINKLIQLLTGENTDSPKEVAKANGLIQISDDSVLIKVVKEVIDQNPGPVQQYKEGKVQVIGFLIGCCMKASKGQGNPQKFKELLTQELK